MAENDKASGPAPTAEGAPVTPPKRSPGHRGADVKDTVAEMAAKAHEISLEAGSKMAAAMKDVVNAAAGLSGFVLESARDLVQYMVRRGQMTQEEADKLIRQVEEHQPKRKPVTPPPAPAKSAPAAHTTHTAHTSHSGHPAHTTHHAPVSHAKHAPAKPAAKPSHAKPAHKSAAKPAPKKAAKSAAKAPAKKPAAKKPAAKKAAKRK